jgi:hypothetical protein
MIEGEQEEFTAEALRRGGVQIAQAGPDLLRAFRVSVIQPALLKSDLTYL